MSKPQKYLEYRCDVENGKPVNKVLTKRGYVSIHEHEAEENNANVKRMKLWYELADEKPVKSEKRLELEKNATELGISFRDNISDVKLESRINEHLNK